MTTGPPETASVDELSRREDVQQALEQTTGARPAERPSLRAGDWAGLGTGLLLFVALALAAYLLRLGIVDLPDRFEAPASRVAFGAAAVVLAVCVGRLANLLFVARLRDPVARFNLRRVLHVLVAIAIGMIALSVLFADWTTAAVSLGLLSLILGFALQTPITSFIGWIYILVRAPYRVGDRIRIGDATGDVIDVGYLDTTLWEFGGEYLSSDHPSGRIIRIPNSEVLSSSVFNYSWPLFPYMWNEIVFHVAYGSDLQFVGQTMKAAADEEVGAVMRERVAAYRELLARTPVDHLEVREEPAVYFRVSANTWVEAIVRYLVDPRQAGRVKSRLIRTMLERLNAEPERVLFPRGDAR